MGLPAISKLPSAEVLLARQKSAKELPVKDQTLRIQFCFSILAPLRGCSLSFSTKLARGVKRGTTPAVEREDLRSEDRHTHQEKRSLRLSPWLAPPPQRQMPLRAQSGPRTLPRIGGLTLRTPVPRSTGERNSGAGNVVVRATSRKGPADRPR